MTTLKPLFTWLSALVECDELSGDARHVGLTLSLHMSELGDSPFPSLDTLVQETGRSRRVVMQALHDLEEAGFLGVERDQHPAGGGRR
ncbi:MAG: helix-turn-helix domain-containing protein [Actinomycetota bacterium]